MLDYIWSFFGYEPTETTEPIKTYNTNSRQERFCKFMKSTYPDLTDHQIKRIRITFHKLHKAYLTNPKLNKGPPFNFNYLAHKLGKIYYLKHSMNLIPVPDNIWERNEKLWNSVNIKLE